MLASFQSCGRVPLLIDCVKMWVRTALISVAVSLSIIAWMPSGPVALLGSMFRRSFSTPCIWILMFSIGKNWDGKIFGIADFAGSVVNTDWNCLLRMSAFSWLEDLSADLSSESCWMPVVSCLRLLMYLKNALGFSLIEGPSLLLMKSDLASRSSFWTLDLMLRNADQSFCAWVFLALLYTLFLFDHSFDCSRDNMGDCGVCCSFWRVQISLSNHEFSILVYSSSHGWHSCPDLRTKTLADEIVIGDNLTNDIITWKFSYEVS